MHSFLYQTKLLTSLLLIFTIFSSTVSAQTRRAAATKTAASNAQGAQKCDGAWSGVVSYKRRLSTENTQGTSDFLKKNFVGASSQETFKREVVYEGKIILDGKPDQRTPQYGVNNGGQYMGASSQKGRVSAEISESENRQSKSVRRDSCGANDTRDKTCENSTVTEGAASVSGESNFGLTFQNGVYGFSFSFPEANSTKKVSKKSSCQNFCQNKNNGSTSTSETFPARYEQERVSVKNQKYDPKNADRLQGSVTETAYDGKTVTTISWNLRKCAAPLQIIDLKFEHHQFPNPEEWVAVSEKAGTIDGNQVKIKATIFNSTPTEQNVTVNFKETKENLALPNGKATDKIGAGETKEIEFLWDTNGFAWNDSGKPEPAREIKAEITGDSKTEKIKIIPKPVILVHGLWSNAAAWADWHGYLREAHTFAWEAFPVGENPSVAKMNTGDHLGNYEATNTVYQNAQELGKQIKWVREQKNAWHVDLVAHSMGGLISRQYIDTMMPQVFDGKPEVAHLVMLGTPNMGSPCADLVSPLFEFFNQKNMHAMRELRPSVVADFNKRVTARRGVKFSILVGWAIPRTCQADLQGDGVVSIGSALFNISDRGYAFRHHVSLTSKTPFDDFVLPRLALGPKKAQAESANAWMDNFENGNLASVEDDSLQNDRYGFGKVFQNISFKSVRENQNADETESLTTKEKIVLQAKQTQEIEIPANAADQSGVLLIAAPDVSARLINESGVIVGESVGGAEASKNLFRTILVDKPAGKTFKLKLENSGAAETIVFVAGFAAKLESANFIVEYGKQTAAGNLPLRAKWIENNLPVTGAKITAKIIGQAKTILFFDDGKHADGAAGDGVYGASVEKLKKGDYLLEAEAATSERTASANTLIKIEN